VILAVDSTQRGFADRQDVAAVATEARATPDHILRIGARSAVVHAADEVETVLTAFERDYRDYFARHEDRVPAGLGMLNPLPRVVLVPGLGAVASGTDAKTARANAEIAFRSHRVTAMTRDAFGTVDWLSEADVFDFDYWPLELAKLASAPAPRLLAGHVVILLDAGTPTADAIAARLTAEGAHLVLAGPDPAAVAAAVAKLPVGTAITTTTEAAVATAVETFGGVDILVSAHSAPHAMLAELSQVFTAQGLGGAIVLVRSDPQVERLRQFEAFGPDIRINAIRHHNGAAPGHVAESVVYLASSRSDGVDGVTLPIT
jgi:hypothetical protein